MSSEIVGLFRRLTLGVYIVGVRYEAEQDAFTVASAMQVSYSPLLLALAVNPEHASYRLLRAGGAFGLSVLAADQIELASRFGTPGKGAADKMRGIRWRTGLRGVPILEESLGFFDCLVRAEWPAGDHRVFLGEVLSGELLRADAAPLRYADTRDLDHSAALYPRSFEAHA